MPVHTLEGFELETESLITVPHSLMGVELLTDSLETEPHSFLGLEITNTDPDVPVPTHDFCDVAFKLQGSLEGVEIIAELWPKGYFFSTAPVDPDAAKAYDVLKRVTAITDSNGEAVLSLTTINNRLRTLDPQSRWIIRVPRFGINVRVTVPDAAIANFADIID